MKVKQSLRRFCERVKETFTFSKGEPITLQEIRQIESRARSLREMELSKIRARSKTDDVAYFAQLSAEQQALAAEHARVVIEYERKTALLVRQERMLGRAASLPCD